MAKSIWLDVLKKDWEEKWEYKFGEKQSRIDLSGRRS